MSQIVYFSKAGAYSISTEHNTV